MPEDDRVSLFECMSQLLAVWLMHEHATDKTPDFQLVELGPGRGTLMNDVIRVSRTPWRVREREIVSLKGAAQTKILGQAHVLRAVRSERVDATTTSRKAARQIGRSHPVCFEEDRLNSIVSSSIPSSRTSIEYRTGTIH